MQQNFNEKGVCCLLTYVFFLNIKEMLFIYWTSGLVQVYTKLRSAAHPIEKVSSSCFSMHAFAVHLQAAWQPTFTSNVVYDYL